MTRILIFSLTYFPQPVGGAEIAIHEITDRISPQDIEFDMVTLRLDRSLPKKERMGNVTVYRVGFTALSPTSADLVSYPLKLNKFFFPLLATLKAIRLHKKHSYDGVWVIMAAFAGFGALFFSYLYPRVPYVLTLQEGDPIPYIKHKVRFVYPLFRRIFLRASVIQTISNYLARFARSMEYRGPIEVVPNGVDVKYFSSPWREDEKLALSRALQKREEDIYLITVSRLVRKNAIDDCISALTFLPSHVHLLIVGEGPDRDALTKLSEESGVRSRTHFLGHITHEHVPKYLHISDIFLRPSLSEGMGNAFVEAMAAGLPVIGTQEGGIADFLFDPNLNPDKLSTGRVVAPHDPHGIAEAVTRYLTDTETTFSIIKNARAMVAEKYDWRRIADEMKSRVFSKI